MESVSVFCETSNHVGVSWNKTRKKWRVDIRHAGKTHYLGLFADEQKAVAAYAALKFPRDKTAHQEAKEMIAKGTLEEWKQRRKETPHFLSLDSKGEVWEESEDEARAKRKNNDAVMKVCCSLWIGSSGKSATRGL